MVVGRTRAKSKSVMCLTVMYWWQVLRSVYCLVPRVLGVRLGCRGGALSGSVINQD